MNKVRALLPALLALALPALAQSLPDKFKDHRTAWEEGLAKGDSASVRKATEALLAQDGPAVNPSDYDAMHAMVATMNLAAQACVMEGAWEDAVAHLQKAAQASTDNLAAAEGTFAKIRQEQQAGLKTWRGEVAKLEQRLQVMDAQGGLTSEQIKTRTVIRDQLAEYNNSIALGERSLAEMDSTSAQLKKEQEVYAASYAQWQAFLASEKAEITQAGSTHAYVTEKLEQVKGDDAKPQLQRLTYARRLLHLDPANADCRRLVNGLSGKDEAAPAPKPAPKKKHKPKPKAADDAQ